MSKTNKNKKVYPSNPSSLARASFSAWLSQLDFIEDPIDRVRATSALLNASNIIASVNYGDIYRNEKLVVKDAAWIDLKHDQVVEFHTNPQQSRGVLIRKSMHYDYYDSAYQPISDFTAQDFEDITGQPIQDFQPLPKQALLPKHFAVEGVLTDLSGHPLVVYRGEHGLMDGKGFQSRLPSLSFGSCRAASGYATDPNDSQDQPYQPRVYPCFLKVKNPLPVSKDDPFFDFTIMERIFGFEFAKKMFLKHERHVTDTNAFHELACEMGIQSLEQLVEKDEERLRKLYFYTWAALDDSEFIMAAKEHGYDGAIYIGSGETATELEYRVFDESQVIYALSVPPDRSLARNKAVHDEPSLS